MDPLLSFITQPWVVVLIAIGVFVGRVMFLARRLRSAARHPTLADTRALDEAKKALDSHRKSLDGARETLKGNLSGARDTLRHYKGSLESSVDGRRHGLETAMKGLQGFHEPLQKARDEPKAALRTGLSDAKKIYKLAVPQKPRRSSKGSPKDI